MNILSLDTACGDISVSVIKDGRIYMSEPVENTNGKTRSTTIVPVLEHLLKKAELDWNELHALALGAGPGSFTGLRIAAATLAGINSGLKLPIYHLSSLAITACQADADGPVWVLEDARAGEAFVGCYQNDTQIRADVCLSWKDVAALSLGHFCCHGEPPVELNGWTRLPLTIDRSAALAMETQLFSARLNTAGSDLPVYPSPTYLQLSQAERNAHE
ncbi:MAG: tRNA (adenosine(37)-N6)-threonylcarbamoyltransferase complex dimerization subunit type 1 TsaB [Mariprofundus sp.]|nr:tRNA (adenosine(37)-N6)-threonylcarbamoyltransferase complex dimerization subunit type 1 TsaB [Mariprofundus sp.]